MATVILWALGTGIITGAVWFGIVVMRRDPKRQLPPASKPEELANLERRLTEVEERLGFAERQLTKQREVQRLPP